MNNLAWLWWVSDYNTNVSDVGVITKYIVNPDVGKFSCTGDFSAISSNGHRYYEVGSKKLVGPTETVDILGRVG